MLVIISYKHRVLTIDSPRRENGAHILSERTAPDARSRMKSATLVPYGSVKPSLWNQSAAKPACTSQVHRLLAKD